VEVNGLRMLGRGVAYTLRSRALDSVRADLSRAFKPWLTGQDREGFRPHVTVQNKVSSAEAKGLHAHLLAGFAPFDVRAEGIQLWHYRGGPWSPAGAIAFA
ncbi:MAG: 2'-5' RNA ligase family protein, partial [Pseudomonadota bacterium]